MIEHQPNLAAQEFPTDYSNSTVHIDELLSIENAIEKEDVVAKETAIEKEAITKLIDKQEFTLMFLGGFGIAHTVTDLNTLKLQGEQQQKAVACAGEFYDMILECKSMHWVLSPSGKWAKRCYIVGGFTSSIAFGCVRDVKQKKILKAQKEAVHQAEQLKEEQQFNITDPFEGQI